MRQMRVGGDVDEALLECDLIEAAAERKEGNLDAFERPAHIIEVGDVARDELYG